jgi:O-antigen/teichoic acid export membrane protein
MLQSIISRTFYLGITFFANLVLANILMPSHFGNVSLLIINGAIISLITGFGIDSLIMYSITNRKWDVSYGFSIMWWVIGLQIALFILLQSISIFSFGFTILSENSSAYFFTEVLYFAGIILIEKYLALFYSIGKSLIVNLILLLFSIAYFILLLALYYSSEKSYFTILNVMSIQTFLQGIVLAVVFKKKSPTKFRRINLNNLISAIGISSVIMITNIIQFFAYRIDFFFLKKFYGEYEVGIYAQCNKFANLLWILPNILAPLLLTKFNDIKKTDITNIFQLACLLNIIVALMTIVFAHICYASFLLPAYASGIQSFYFMLPGYFSWALVIYFAAYFAWLGKFKYNLIASSFCLACILVCDIIFIPLLSIKGAAIANSIAYSSSLAINILLFLKDGSFKLSDLVRLRKIQLNSFVVFFKNEKN